MPIYEYRCAQCENRFEELVFETKPAIVNCPKCGTSEVSRLISLFAAATNANSLASMSGESSSHACGCGSCSCGQG